MRNKAYANTLKALARRGAEAFYHGPIAKDIADAVIGDLNIPGDMTVDDLANYRVVEREPVCIDFLGYDVCGMGPPSSGALAVGQILGIVANRPNLMGTHPLDVDTVHLFTQAGRLAFADRGEYVADNTAKLSGTSHVSIVDRYGNALVHDHDGGKFLRKRRHGARFSAQQRADRFLVRLRRR